MIHPFAIVGAGAAGTFAALALRAQRPLVLDVGIGPRAGLPDVQDLSQARRSADPFGFLIGEQFESLHNIESAELTPKVKSPFMRYVVQPPQSQAALQSVGCRPIASYATGGLANAWGAQVYRFNDADLKGFPIKSGELTAYYDLVEREIGVSGDKDDLSDFHGQQDLLPPLALGTLARDLLARYERKRSSFRRRGVVLGRPRLAVLSVAHRGRAPYKYDNLEFFQPRTPGIYSPVYTLDSLIADHAVDYRPGWLVERYHEHPDCVELFAVSERTGERTSFKARTALLCLGALNTGGLVLRARNDVVTRLPVVENPMSMAPLLSLRHIGSTCDQGVHSGQLNLVCNEPKTGEYVIGMLYALDGLLRSDLLYEFPLDARGCLSAARYVLPAMMMLQVFHAGRVRAENCVRLDPSGALVVEFQPHGYTSVEHRIMRAFRSVGYLSHSRLLRRATPGGSVHYGGTLPMKETPGAPYSTDRDGLLFGSRRVFIADSATFPALPAKNLTLTIMSNAMRVAEAALRRQVESS